MIGELRPIAAMHHEITGQHVARCFLLKVDLPLVMSAQDARGEVVDVDDPSAEDWFCGGCGDWLATSSDRG